MSQSGRQRVDIGVVDSFVINLHVELVGQPHHVNAFTADCCVEVIEDGVGGNLDFVHHTVHGDPQTSHHFAGCQLSRWLVLGVCSWFPLR